MNTIDSMRKLKKELSEKKVTPVYNLFLVKGILNTIRILNHEKENSKQEDYINKINKAKEILIKYIDNSYDNEIKLSKPQNYLNTLKKLKFYSESNISNLSSLENTIEGSKNYIPEVLKDGFMIQAAENTLKNFKYNMKNKDDGIKFQLSCDAFVATEFLRIKVSDEISEEIKKLEYEVLTKMRRTIRHIRKV